MTLILKQLFGLFKLLNSDTGTRSLAWGFAFGFVLGMTPSFSLQTLLVIAALFFFRIQIGAALVSAFIFKFLAFAFDPLFHRVGDWVLSQPNLESVFTSLYHLPILPFTRFNNTVVMGSAVISIVLLPVIYLIGKNMVIRYRSTVVARYQDSRFFKALQTTSFYKWYVKYDQLFG